MSNELVYEHCVKYRKEAAVTLNSFFTNAIKNLDISRSLCSDQLMGKLKNPALKAIFEYQKYPSIIAIQNSYRKDQVFKFSKVREDDNKNEILKSNINKASQSTDIPTKITKEKSDISGKYLGTSFNMKTHLGSLSV